MPTANDPTRGCSRAIGLARRSYFVQVGAVDTAAVDRVGRLSEGQRCHRAVDTAVVHKPRTSAVADASEALTLSGTNEPVATDGASNLARVVHAVVV